MTDHTVNPTDDEIVRHWTDTLNTRLASHDFGGVGELFVERGYLRDLVALTWDFRTIHGRSDISKTWATASVETNPGLFRLNEPSFAKRKRKPDGSTVIETFLTFETRLGFGLAILRLTEDGACYRATVLATALDGLKGHPERVRDDRPIGTASLDTVDGKNWLDRRVAEVKYLDRDPEVLVVGAGQSGLGLAARLKALDVDVLLIDQLPRVGDVWRRRYHTLTLHNAVWLNHLPYMPFPDTWPVYIPKDKLADWFESYADAMELNVWTSTTLIDANYDSRDRRWTVTVENKSDERRIIRPQHVVMATGTSGEPNLPSLPGLANFDGTVIHSSHYRAPEQGVTRAVVFGTGNSAHDIAQDLYVNGGCDVTMIQRNSTTVVDLSTVHELYDRFSKRLPPALSDLMLVATPYDLAIEAFQSMTREAIERDSDLIANLEAVGFRTDYGADETGHRMKYLRYGGGYYINIGCSNLITEGAIDIVRSDQIDTISSSGLTLIDGRLIPADLIVLATGYQNQSSLVRRVFGAEVAERVGGIWGYDDQGELQSMYKRTGQPGLWFHAGSLPQSRIYSKLLALQLKGCLEGIIDPEVTQPSYTS